MIVIADDITGAAEIAGIAFAHGEKVRLVCSGSVCRNLSPTDGITVYATDTRSMSEAEAVAEIRRIASQFSIFNFQFSIFKKIDSALRGHVVAELTALMQATGHQRAVFLPANPSKGRVIRNGTYYIDNVPIHETDFSFDPEFPAHTSVLSERFPEAEAPHIIMPDAGNVEDIRNVIATYNDGKTIFAGAADLFRELRGMTRKSILVLCGSTQSKPLELGIPVAPMPKDIYDGSSDLSLWDTSAYSDQHSLILSIPYAHRTGKEVAVHLRTMMAEKARQLVTEHCPDHLMIEGGATAWATLQSLGWTDFAITAQLASGIVQMSTANGTLVTLKPGSYPWGAMITSLFHT